MNKSMYKAKYVYYDKSGNMVKSTRDKNVSSLIKSDIQPDTTVTKRLKAVGLGWLNNGWALWLADDTGRKYPMSSSVLHSYLKNHDIDFGERTFEFLQRGDTYSIGFVED